MCKHPLRTHCCSLAGDHKLLAAASSAVMQQTRQHTATTAQEDHKQAKVIANPLGSTHEHACNVANAMTHSTTATAHNLTSVYVYSQHGTVPQHGLPKGAMLTCHAGAATLITPATIQAEQRLAQRMWNAGQCSELQQHPDARHGCVGCSNNRLSDKRSHRLFPLSLVKVSH
jgi:hypothetical protein